MEFSKKTWKNLFLVVTGALLIAFGLRHIDVVASAVSAVLSLLSPIFIGICIAFIVNIPMRALESLWDRLFLRNVKQSSARKGDRFSVQLCRGLRRPVCMILSLLLIMGLLFAVAFLLIPQLGEAFNDFSAMLPGYLADLESLWVKAQTLLDDFGFVLPDFAIDIKKLNTDGIFSTVKNIFDIDGKNAV